MKKNRIYRRVDFLKKSLLESFMEQLFEFPLWVKQVIYLRLREHLEGFLSDEFLNTKIEDSFHLYRPKLSYIGKTELLEKEAGLDANLYTFLGMVEEGYDIITIALNNFWTIEEVSKYFIFCCEQNYIKSPVPNPIMIMAGYLAGKYRTGEYFKRIGKINIDQLEHTIRIQKELREKGERPQFVELMIEFGYITEADSKALLITKEQASKRFILDVALIPEGMSLDGESADKYIAEVNELKHENAKLKSQLNKILLFLKKNAK